jgi:hypothetical protein
MMYVLLRFIIIKIDYLKLLMLTNIQGKRFINILNLLTPRSRVLLQQLTCSQLVKKFPAFYGNPMFITAFKTTRHLFLSWARSIHSMPSHSTFCGSILILSSHLSLGLPNGLFPSDVPIKILYTPLLFPIHSTCPTQLILLDFITLTILGKEYR